MIIAPKKSKILTVPIYNVDILLLSDRKQFDKLTSSLGIDGEPDWVENRACNGFFSLFMHQGEQYYILAVFNGERRTAIHECVHAAQGILQTKGIEISWDNSETCAYLTDYLCEKVLKKLNIG